MFKSHYIWDAQCSNNVTPLRVSIMYSQGSSPPRDLEGLRKLQRSAHSLTTCLVYPLGPLHITRTPGSLGLSPGLPYGPWPPQGIPQPEDPKPFPRHRDPLMPHMKIYPKAWIFLLEAVASPAPCSSQGLP